MDIPKRFDSSSSREKWYRFWQEHDLFHADPAQPKPKYSVVIPPPNVTGKLHIGHALNNTLQDILCRWRRMDGYEVFWMQGTAHAGIAGVRWGEGVCCKRDAVTRRRYWRWDRIPRSGRPEGERAEEVNRQFMAAVDLRLRHDQASVAFLSGGMDSRCVVAARAVGRL